MAGLQKVPPIMISAKHFWLFVIQQPLLSISLRCQRCYTRLPMGAEQIPPKTFAIICVWSHGQFALQCFQMLVFPPAAAGGVPGILQTVLRAEITAVIAACRFGVHHHKPFYIWTWADCQVVFDRVQVMLSQENFAVTPRQKDHDLWQTLQTLVLRAKAMGLFHKILKVTSHQAHTEYSSLVDRWAIEGNEAADAAATWARTLLPTAVLQAHRRLQVESEQR